MNMLTKALEVLQLLIFLITATEPDSPFFFTAQQFNIYVSRLAAHATSLYLHIMYVYLDV